MKPRTKTTVSGAAPRSRWEKAVARWLGRCVLALLAPLIFFGGLEGVLRLVGYGQDLAFFVPDKQPGYYCTNPAFTSLFTPPSFALRPAPFRMAERKPLGVRRIFVIGESAVMGVPAIEFGLVPQLRTLLRARHPEAAIEVCNLGITAINSHVLYWAVKDAARFSPDLFVIYMGNNEVVGPYGPGAFYSNMLPPQSWTPGNVYASASPCRPHWRVTPSSRRWWCR